MNVKLVSENNHVLYVATSVYANSKEGRLTKEMTNWIFNVGHNSGSYTSDISIPVGSGLDPELSSKYHNMSADLAYQLSKKGGIEEA